MVTGVTQCTLNYRGFGVLLEYYPSNCDYGPPWYTGNVAPVAVLETRFDNVLARSWEDVESRSLVSECISFLGNTLARGQRTSWPMPPCRDAEPHTAVVRIQYHQNVNNKLGLYPIGNGLSRRKQL